MKALIGMLVAGALVTAVFGVWLRAQDDPPASHIQAMLQHVPSEASAIESGWATVSFVDFDALFESEGLSAIRALGNVELLMTSVPIGSILGRIIAGPEALTYVFPGTGEMTEAVGFEWLLDVDGSLEFGDPPNLGLLLGGDFDPDTIGTALQSRGFELEEADGIDVWHRFDDLAISIADRNLADPFGGHLGAAARIALLPDTLANARTWALIEAIIAASHGTRPSLADDPAYRALAESISAPDGLLIQALFFSGIALRLAEDPLDAIEEGLDDVEPLPYYSLAVLADRQEDDDQVALIALACPDEPTAQTASDILVERLRVFRPPSRPGDDALADRFDADISVSEVKYIQDGVAIAAVEARYPLPDERRDPETGLYNTRGLLFRSWIQAILYREFTPLW